MWEIASVGAKLGQLRARRVKGVPRLLAHLFNVVERGAGLDERHEAERLIAIRKARR